MHVASANGHTEIVRMLLEVESIEINIHNEGGNTPLHWAALNGKEEICNLLIKGSKSGKKANPNAKNEFNRQPIEEALQAGHTSIAENLAQISKLDDEKIYS